VHVYTIDQGINMPSRRRSKNDYPLHELKVGDSFLVSEDTAKERSKIRSASYRYKKQVDPTFSIAIRADAKGFRVWRTR
jgi:hypothetical protein